MAPPIPLAQLLAPVVAYVVHADGAAFTLSFAEIGELIGAPLPMRVKVWADTWQLVSLPTGRHCKQWAGARLDFPQRHVIFRRIDPGMQEA
jgi:hypothetical protein